MKMFEKETYIIVKRDKDDFVLNLAGTPKDLITLIVAIFDNLAENDEDKLKILIDDFLTRFIK